MTHNLPKGRCAACVHIPKEYAGQRLAPSRPWGSKEGEKDPINVKRGSRCKNITRINPQSLAVGHGGEAIQPPKEKRGKFQKNDKLVEFGKFWGRSSPHISTNSEGRGESRKNGHFKQVKWRFPNESAALGPVDQRRADMRSGMGYAHIKSGVSGRELRKLGGWIHKKGPRPALVRDINYPQLHKTGSRKKPPLRAKKEITP